MKWEPNPAPGDMSLKVFSVRSACFIWMWIELYGLRQLFDYFVLSIFKRILFGNGKFHENCRLDGELYSGRHNETASHRKAMKWVGKRQLRACTRERKKTTTKISTYLSNYRTKLRNTLVSFIALLMITICCVLSVIAFFPWFSWYIESHLSTVDSVTVCCIKKRP